MKKVFVVSIALIVLLAGLGWASGAQEPKGQAGAEQGGTLGTAAAPATITWWFGDWNEPRGTNLARQFEQAHPNIKVNGQPQVGQGILNKIQVALRSGSPPDVLNVAIGWNIPFAQSGFLTQLDDRIRSAGLQTDDFFQTTWETARLQGQAYGIPYRTESHAFIYNKGMYQAVGLDPNKPPETWAELLDYSQRLTTTIDGRQVYGYGIAGGGEVNNMIYLLLPMIWMNGGAVLSEDGKQVKINERPAVEAVERYTAYYLVYNVAPASTLENDGTDIRRLFEQKVLAQLQSGSYTIPAARQADPSIEIGTALIPHPFNADPAAVQGGWNYTIPKDARNKDAAWEFIQFMVQPENMATFTDTFPARQSAMKAERFQDPILEPFIEMLKYTRMTPTVESWPQISSVIFSEVQSVLLRQKTPQQAMDDAAAAIQSLL